MEKIKKNLKALINQKPVIAAALITAASTIALALFSSDKLILKVEANELQSAVGVEPSPEKETISRLRTELNSRVSAAALHDLSDTYFPENAGTAAIKDTIRMLVRHDDTYRADRKHYTYRMFRLKKIMLNMPRRNINTRIEGAGTEAFMLIQQLLKGIEYYEGPVDGDRLKTYFAVKKFPSAAKGLPTARQEDMNNYTPGYFNADNYGIFGNGTLMAVIAIYDNDERGVSSDAAGSLPVE